MEKERSANQEAQPGYAAAINVDTTSGIKQGHTAEEDKPVVAVAAKIAAYLRKITRKKMAARIKQSAISFDGVAAGTSAGRPDEAAARHTAAGRTQAMVNQKQKFI